MAANVSPAPMVVLPPIHMYIYQGDLEKLQGHKPFGTNQCVALVQTLTNVGNTKHWRAGPKVNSLDFLPLGTVIANFKRDARGNLYYPNEHGYHAALFGGFGGPKLPNGNWEWWWEGAGQWVNRMPYNVVKKRPIYYFGDKSFEEGNVKHDCDNNSQYYVVTTQ
jgi:hypothetical protein